MNLPSRAALLTAGLAATATLFAPAIAAADPAPSEPLLQSTCSFAQIDAALHATAPKFADRLDAHPKVEQTLTDLFNQPADQRQATVDRFRADHPKIAERLDQARTGPHAEKINDELTTVADTCHSY